MKNIIILLAVVFASCKGDLQKSKLVVQNCSTQKWDTIEVKHYSQLHIDGFKQALPALRDGWQGEFLALNVCEFKIISSRFCK